MSLTRMRNRAVSRPGSGVGPLRVPPPPLTRLSMRGEKECYRWLVVTTETVADSQHDPNCVGKEVQHGPVGRSLALFHGVPPIE